VRAPTEDEYIQLALALRDDDVVPFLGAGVGGDPDVWEDGTGRLPNGDALARHLAGHFHYPKAALDLARVAQYAATMRGYPSLKKVLHEVFDNDFHPTPLHELLARLPTLLAGAPYAERGDSFRGYQLIVTTNYDDTLERAFRAADEPFDLITYDAELPGGGKFVYWPGGVDPRRIEDSNEHLSLAERTVIVKIHGRVVREVGTKHESFVITEDHYIDYLAHAGISELLPVQVQDRLVNGSLLFLGYALKDWNLRVMLEGIWRQRGHYAPATWSVQVGADSFEEKFWSDRGRIQFFAVRLEEFVPALAARLDEVLASP
jgi:hypothetical protein